LLISTNCDGLWQHGIFESRLSKKQMPALALDQSGRQRALSIASGGHDGTSLCDAQHRAKVVPSTFGLACLARSTCKKQAGLSIRLV
jgi:hypothetical protein